MKKILITGSAGQLGKCLQDIVKEDSNNHYIFTDFEELDITDKNCVDQFFNNKNFDYCINCAAYTAVDKAESDIERVYEVNAEGIRNLSRACKLNNVILIHISTDFVFDGNKTIPYIENDTPNPINVYGASKLKGEKYVREILGKYFIIRTSWVYSEHGNNFMKTMLKLGKEKDELNIVVDQIGSPTYAGDLAKVVVKLIETEKNDYGTYHFSNEGVASWYDFAVSIFNEAKIKINLTPISTKEYPTPAQRPHYSVLDKTKIKNQLKIQIPYWTESLKTALKKVELK